MTKFLKFSASLSLALFSVLVLTACAGQQGIAGDKDSSPTSSQTTSGSGDSPSPSSPDDDLPVASAADAPVNGSSSSSEASVGGNSAYTAFIRDQNDKLIDKKSFSSEKAARDWAEKRAAAASQSGGIVSIAISEGTQVD